jgi:hypothetical protein
MVEIHDAQRLTSEAALGWRSQLKDVRSMEGLGVI